MKNAAVTPCEAYKIMFREYPDVVGVDGLRQMLGGIGRTSAYRLLREGKVHSLRLGRTYMIPKLSVITYLCGEVPLVSTEKT